MKRKQLYCPHFQKEVKKTGVYSYYLIGAEINLCKNCEKKLRKEIFEQDKIEKETKNLFKKDDGTQTFKNKEVLE